MKQSLRVLSNHARGNRVVRVLLLLALILTMLGTVPPRPAVARAQSQLIQLAAAQPDKTVGVIVQKTTKDTSLEGMVERAGGRVTRNLRIINAFAAKLSAKAAVELSSQAGVRWVSLDAPITKSGLPPTSTSWATDVSTASNAAINATFNSYPILTNRYLWLSSSFSVSGTGSNRATIYFENSSLSIVVAGQTFSMPVPDATIVVDPAASNATVSFDSVNGNWNTTVPTGVAGGDIFLSSLSLKVPFNLPGNLGPITWSGRFTSDTPGLTVTGWKWSGSVFSRFSNNYNSLGVKPCGAGQSCGYSNSDAAGTPESFKTSVVAGATGSGGTNYTGTRTPPQQVSVPQVFVDNPNVFDAPNGPNNTFGSLGNVVVSATGLSVEHNPDQAISRVEAVFKAYVPSTLAGTSDLKVRVTVGEQTSSNVVVSDSVFNSHVGRSNAGLIYANITSLRSWQWADFDNNLQLTLDQSSFGSNRVYYDAVGVRVTMNNTPDGSGEHSTPAPPPGSIMDPSKLQNVYDISTRATDVWTEAPRFLQGQGVTVAVVDSGVMKTEDLDKRLIGAANFNDDSHTAIDGFGHGTHVAGIVAGDGKESDGAYVGIAPRANVLNVRVSNDTGMSTESDVVAGLQYIYDHKSQYNIRVVNMSLNAGAMESPETSPLDAACEVLWFNGIVVVVSAGNNGTANLFPPANDPFVITVGAADDHGTATLADDDIASFSAYGTGPGGVKPDLVAPGKNIVALLPQNIVTSIGLQHQGNRINVNYFSLSGTSMAAPMVSGAVALLLQDEPTLTPDQVKYRLKATAVHDTAIWPRYDPERAGAGYLNIYAAVHGTTTNSANTGLEASRLLWTGDEPVNWGSVNWNSVNWNSVNWNSVNWNSVNWNSVNWNSDYWDR